MEYDFLINRLIWNNRPSWWQWFLKNIFYQIFIFLKLFLSIHLAKVILKMELQECLWQIYWTTRLARLSKWGHLYLDFLSSFALSFNSSPLPNLFTDPIPSSTSWHPLWLLFLTVLSCTSNSQRFDQVRSACTLLPRVPAPASKPAYQVFPSISAAQTSHSVSFYSYLYHLILTFILFICLSFSTFHPTFFLPSTLPILPNRRYMNNVYFFFPKVKSFLFLLVVWLNLTPRFLNLKLSRVMD